jgi:hypothetical protein
MTTAPMTAAATITPRVGAVAIAIRECAVFAFEEAGVCYEAYRIGGTPGWAFIFERGGFDGFSAADLALDLHLTGVVAPELEHYDFQNIGQLREDWRRGVFAPGFARTRTVRGGRG